MIRLFFKYSASWYCFCCVFPLLSTGFSQCSCVEGFTVAKHDNTSCQANDPNWKLIFATRQSVQYTEQKDLEQFGPVEVTNVGRPVAVTYDARSGLTYWTDASDNSEAIYRKSVTGEGGSEEIVADAGIILPEGIAYDWITGNVYFADSNQSHIAVCGNSSNFCSVVVREMVDKPRDIALDPNQGIMVWTDWGTNPAIMRSGMDGSFPTPIVSTDLKWPNGITIDHGNGRVYWVDAGMDKVETVLIDGRDRQVVISIQKSHLFGVDVLGDRIFWSDWNNFNIQSANKLTGGSKKIHVAETGVLMNGLAVYHIANQPITRLNPCLTARCSHICTLSNVVNFRCVCPVGMVLDNDDRTCVEPNNLEKLIIAFKNMIKTMRFNSIGREVFESISFPELKAISAVVYNPVNHTIIMSDSSHKKIYEYSLNRKRLTVLVEEHLDEVKGMDIDVIGENLYWVDGGKQTVEVMSFRTRARKVLMSGVENPYDILVVPQLGSLYLSTLGRRGGKIYKSFMNGYGSSVFQRVGEKEPVGLAYDREVDNILWADKANRGVESISTDGKRSSIVITGQTGPPSDVVKHGNEIYWTDMFSDDLKSVSLGSQFVRSTKIGSFESNSTLVEMNNQTLFYPKMTVINKDLSYLDMLLGSHECSLKSPKRKACSHICAMIRANFTGACMCSEGHTLDADGITCLRPSTCSHNQFTCKDGHCINLENICDGTADCSDHDDETNCRDVKCQKDFFKCEANGVCIPSHWVCDGDNNCPDRADEVNCDYLPCNKDSDFRCDSGRCIPKSWQCDHAIDCLKDDSDERGCNFTCPDKFVQCETSGNCILAHWVCDKEKDCEDGSDELQNCTYTACPESQFTCNNGQCIEQALVCDGSAHCASNEDEAHCRDGITPSERDGNSNVTTVPIVEVSKHDGNPNINGSADCANNEAHCRDHPCLPKVSQHDGNGCIVCLVLLITIILIAICAALVLVRHKRNPCVHYWNRYINEPAQRSFLDGRRQEEFDCEMTETGKVGEAGATSYHNTIVSEDVDDGAIGHHEPDPY